MKKLLVVCSLVIFAGCSQLGLATATSPSEGLAYAYGNVAAIRSTAASALTAGTITATQAQSILAITDKARATLDAGEAVAITTPTNTAGIAGYLTTATELLTQAQALLPQLATPAK
jgi:hypothetical protein